MQRTKSTLVEGLLGRSLHTGSEPHENNVNRVYQFFFYNYIHVLPEAHVQAICVKNTQTTSHDREHISLSIMVETNIIQWLEAIFPDIQKPNLLIEPKFV